MGRGDNRVLSHFRQRNVVSHVVQIRAIVLAHDEELAAVAEHGRADAALLEARILARLRGFDLDDAKQFED
jgi:hypothetical protein